MTRDAGPADQSESRAGGNRVPRLMTLDETPPVDVPPDVQREMYWALVVAEARLAHLCDIANRLDRKRGGNGRIAERGPWTDVIRCALDTAAASGGVEPVA